MYFRQRNSGIQWPWQEGKQRTISRLVKAIFCPEAQIELHLPLLTPQAAFFHTKIPIQIIFFVDASDSGKHYP
jgi:hypothetical protein